MVQSRDSGLGEKIKSSGDNAREPDASIACERALPLISRAVWSRILIKEDIPSRAGVDRPSELQLLKMNKCEPQCVRPQRSASVGERGPHTSYSYQLRLPGHFPVEVIQGAHESEKKRQTAFDQFHDTGRSGD